METIKLANNLGLTKPPHQGRQRYRDRLGSPTKTLSQIILSSLLLFEFFQVCSCIGTIEVHFLHFSGDDCGGYRDVCDPSFDFCLGRPQSWSLTALADSTCHYGLADADAESPKGRYDNMIELDLSSETSIHGIPNPWTVQTPSFYDVQNNGEKIDLVLLIRVMDWDDGGLDDDMYLWRLDLIQKVWPSKQLAQWQEYTEDQRRGSITFKIRLYCDPDYYGVKCDTYCKASGEYCCDSEGTMVLRQGSQCENYWPTTALSTTKITTTIPTTTPPTSTSSKTITTKPSTTMKSTSITTTPTTTTTSPTTSSTTTSTTIPTTTTSTSTATTTASSTKTTTTSTASTKRTTTKMTTTRTQVMTETNPTSAPPIPRLPATTSGLNTAETFPRRSIRETTTNSLDETTDNANITYIGSGSTDSLTGRQDQKRMIIAAGICGVAFFLCIAFIIVYVTVMLRRKVKQKEEIVGPHAPLELEASLNGNGSSSMGFMNALYVSASGSSTGGHVSSDDHSVKGNPNGNFNSTLQFDMETDSSGEATAHELDEVVNGAEGGKNLGYRWEMDNDSNGKQDHDTKLEESEAQWYDRQEDEGNVYSDLGI